MKRLFILAIGLGLVSLNTYSAPFYKVKCYDSKNRVVSCDEKARSKKIAKVSKKPAKKESLAEKKARERAMALRELAKQNESLKGELDSLRKANLIAAAKTTEAPAAQAAPAVQASVPAPTPVPTATTQIAKSVEPATPSAWGFEGTNWLSKGFNQATDDKNNKVSSPVLNELDVTVKYKPDGNMVFNAEEDLYWNWNNTTNAPNNGFDADNPAFYFDYNNIYVSESKQTTIGAELKMIPGIKQASRDQGMVAQFYLKALIKTKFADGKGYFKFEPEVDPIINKYSTSAPTLTTYDETRMANTTFNGNGYEPLNPNTRFALAAKGYVGYKILDNVTIETSLKLTSANTYADEVLDGGQLYTITPAGWSTKAQLRLPSVYVSINDNFTAIIRLEAAGKLNSFKPFGVDDNNSLTFIVALDYEI
ncbi:MAG: hypothetical protein WCQ53_03570 [bacterium]